MRNKIVKILALFAVIAAMTGIASAEYNDGDYKCQGNSLSNTLGCLKASFDIPNTEIDASAKLMDTNNFCYQIRYVSPDSITYYGPHIFNTPYSEALNSLHSPPPIWTPGTWDVKLMKGGKTTSGGCQDPTEILTSLIVTVGVPVNPIPEFPTVALPIAAVIGMVFFFQNRKKKEE